MYLFDALPILCCTLAFSIILPWQLDYVRAVGDVFEKIELGLLFPIVWPIKMYIRKKMAERREKKIQSPENPSNDTSIQELDDIAVAKA